MYFQTLDFQIVKTVMTVRVVGSLYMYKINYVASVIQLRLEGSEIAGIVIAVLIVTVALTLLGIYIGYAVR